MGSLPRRGSYERGKFPLPWQPPSPAGRSARTDRELQRLRGGSEQPACPRQNRGGLAQKVPSQRCVPAGVHRGWVLKLGLQQTCLRIILGLAVQRQHKGAGVWSEPQLGEYAGWGPGPPEKPHCSCMHKGRGSPHHNSLILGVLTAGVALPLRALGAHGPRGWPPCRDGLKSERIPRAHMASEAGLKSELRPGSTGRFKPPVAL